LSTTTPEAASTRPSTTRRRRIGPVIAVACLVVIGVVIWVFGSLAPAEDRMVDAPLVGKAAPITEGTQLNGKPFKLSDLKGQWVLVNFMASWCAACKVEHPELVLFSQRHAAAGDAVVVSVANEPAADTAKFFAEQGGDWPVVTEDGSVSTAYGMVKLPETYLVDPFGIVRAKFISAITSDGVDRVIASFTGVKP
jgi:cytochrome c biogenesis protein CcmG/thiol:disulfide interchange protein DsbE